MKMAAARPSWSPNHNGAHWAFKPMCGMKLLLTSWAISFHVCDITFTEPGICKLLQSLNPSKSPGPDELSPRVLREFSTEISPMLTFIFQQSYDSGTLPDDWRIAMVIPIHKKSNKDNPENYRPISLTCLCCKAMEHVILSHLNNFTSENNILSDLQHGFRAGLSCESQLIITVHDWASSINCRGQVDALLLDFSKAFDKVSHAKLLHKLKGYGICGKTYNWISSFLSNRSQFVSVNGSHSSCIPVTSGVPQGSVLGPALFLVFINDITSQSKSQLRLSADDTVMNRKINSFSDHQTLQEDLNNLSKWANDWQMKFNVSKCHLLSVTNKRKPSNYLYTINDEVLPKATEQDYLGVRCCSNLRWGPHCSKVANKANKVLGLLRRTLKPCSKATKEKAYFALVRPILEYAAPVWNPYTDSDVNRIEQVQKNAARFVANNYNLHSSSSEKHENDLITQE
ncbi:putative RNA-directed DNA polymerase from transposon BS [Exaiptasia diaphana]|nr:putative RNA-directed DNA polymerase from transposon BS [Exaiptasia diaphana]